MPKSRSWRSVIVIAGALIGAMALAPAAQASQPTAPAAQSKGPASVGLAAAKVGGPATNEVRYSPSGCRGQSNNPHSSGHVPGTVNAESRTFCNNAVPSILAEG